MGRPWPGLHTEGQRWPNCAKVKGSTASAPLHTPVSLTKPRLHGDPSGAAHQGLRAVPHRGKVGCVPSPAQTPKCVPLATSSAHTSEVVAETQKEPICPRLCPKETPSTGQPPKDKPPQPFLRRTSRGLLHQVQVQVHPETSVFQVCQKEPESRGGWQTLTPRGAGVEAGKKKKRGEARSRSLHLKIMNFVEPSEKVQKIDQVLEGNSGQGGLNRKSALLWMQGSPAKRTLRRGPTGHGHRSAESHFSGQLHLRGLGKHSLQNSLQLHLQKVAGSLQGDAPPGAPFASGPPVSAVRPSPSLLPCLWGKGASVARWQSGTVSEP